MKAGPNFSNREPPEVTKKNKEKRKN